MKLIGGPASACALTLTEPDRPTASKVVKQMAEAEKYDLVIQEAVYVGPRIDITEKVLKALNK